MKQVFLAILITLSANAKWGSLGEIRNFAGKIANSEIQAYNIEKNFKALSESSEILSIVETVENSTATTCNYQEEKGVFAFGSYTLKYKCSGTEEKTLKIKAQINEDAVTIKSYTVKF